MDVETARTATGKLAGSRTLFRRLRGMFRNVRGSQSDALEAWGRERSVAR